MSSSPFVSPSLIRAAFAEAMSHMYAREVPRYRTLLDLVDATNREVLAQDPALAGRLRESGDIARLAGERHGAIRVGTAAELAMIARAFAVMGMVAVDYYDLAPAGVPVHSTAFRAIDAEALRASPFRIFTSLLRLDLIADPALRDEAAAILSARRIFTGEALRLIALAEAQDGLEQADADAFVIALLDTFRWHANATVARHTYTRLLAAHRLVADVVSFRGPHINHLTPRVLDIDAVQAAMPGSGIVPKETIEGPPTRRCPILLRQTSFKALDEPITFAGDSNPGSHTARFGEVEQRGVALTPAGQARYDAWIADGGMLDLPDDWDALRREGLAYFRYRAAAGARAGDGETIEALIADDRVRCDPILYEDFLPVSAAGIFQSNLGGVAHDAPAHGGAAERDAVSEKAAFERALGHAVADRFALYSAIEHRSLNEVMRDTGLVEISPMTSTATRSAPTA